MLISRFVAILVTASVLIGCSGTPQQASSDLGLALNVASAAEAAYSAAPGANPAVAAQLSHLLAAAQAAVLTWQNSSSPANQTAAAAAIAALVAYEASSGAHG